MNTAPARGTCLAPDPSLGSATLGGKGAALAALVAAGFPVPPFFVVAPPADPAAPAEPTRDEAADILAWTERLDAADGARFAVRSSARDEDGAHSSLAGQLDSFLDVPRAEVPGRVAAVRNSARNERAAAYRTARGLGPATAPAVVVQVMVPANSAGVAFSVDPVRADWASSVVAAVRGLGDALVSGATSADTFTVARVGGRVLSVQAGGNGEPALGVDAAAAVAALALRVERHFGRPQDIEWAYAAGTLHLLQARPITTLAGTVDAAGGERVWDNSNIAESYCGVTTPLTYAFARSVYEPAYREFLRMLGVDARTLADHDAVFRRLLGLVRGRIYYSLLDWYRLLALLPGFRFNRRFMEQMMGVKESLPPDVAERLAASGRGERLRDAARLATTLAGLLWQQFRLQARKAAFLRRLDHAFTEPEAAFAGWSAERLAAHYRELERRLMPHWDAPMVNDFLAMVYHGVLRRLCATWLGRESLANDLVGGEGGLVSTEPARLVEELAAEASGDAELVRALEAGPPASASAINARPRFAARVAAYIDRFGDRCLEELKLESPTLRDDPAPLHAAIATRAAMTGGAAPVRRRHDARGAAEAEAARLLAGRPLRRFVLRRVLNRARTYVRDRENLRLQRTRLFGRVRRIFAEIGVRFAAHGRLEAPRDVYYLTVDEILGCVEGTTCTVDTAALAALRRREFDAYRAGDAPADRFTTRGAVHLGNTFTAASAPAAAAAEGDARQGLACCPGVVRGTARVVTDPRGARVLAGEVLVAERTDPGWVMLFPSASGLVVEHGSLLSHSAIVARELGLPAVVALHGATRWLQTGDTIELDGATGVVRRLASGGASPDGA